jgi:hypothetical protein
MNKIRQVTITLALTILTGMSLMPAVASAGPFDSSKNQACQGAQLGADGGCGGAPGTTLSDRIKTIVNILSTIVGIAAIVMIIVGGLRYVTSGGDSGSISGAKNTIIYAIIGLIVVALAQFIVRFVITQTS